MTYISVYSMNAASKIIFNVHAYAYFNQNDEGSVFRLSDVS